MRTEVPTKDDNNASSAEIINYNQSKRNRQEIEEKELMKNEPFFEKLGVEAK